MELLLRVTDPYQYWLNRVTKNGRDLQYAPEKLRNNKDIVMEAVKQDGRALRHASPSLQNDKQVVIEAVKQWGWALEFASPSLQNDKQVVMEAVKQDGCALQYASPSLQNDKQLVIEAVKQYGWALQYASPSLRNDKQVVMAAVKQNDYALQFASPSLKNDKQVVMAAVQNDRCGWALEFASPSLQNDKEVIIAAVKCTSSSSHENTLYDPVKCTDRALNWAHQDLQNDPDVLLAAKKISKDEYTRRKQKPQPPQSSQQQKTQENQAQAAIGNTDDEGWLARFQRNGHSLRDAPKRIRNDKKAVMVAVKQDGFALQYASPQVRNDGEVVTTAIQQNIDAFQFAGPQLRMDKDFVLPHIQSHPDHIKYVDDAIKRDRDILIAAGMYDEDHQLTSSDDDDDDDDVDQGAKKIVLSTRFSLNATSQSEATNITKLLKDHPYIQKGKFKIYAPNAFDKKTCDPQWTNFDHPCRGTSDTCQFDNKLKDGGKPTDACCWRYSYRYHLEKAKESGGFMLQLLETGEEFGMAHKAKLGNGQSIERHMAEQLQMKTFHVYRPNDGDGYEDSFMDRHIIEVVAAIKSWYDNGCRDMSEFVIRPY